MKKEHAKFVVVVALYLATPGSHSKVFAEQNADICKDPIYYNYRFTSLISESKFHDALDLQRRVLTNGNDATKRISSILKDQYLPRALPSVEADQILQKISSMFPLNERIESANECVKAYPNFEYAHLALSIAYWMNQQDSEAEKEALKALSLSPNNPLIVQCLGTVYIYQGREKKARAAIVKLRKLNPKDSLVIEFFREMDKPAGKLTNLEVDRSTFREIGNDKSPRDQLK